MPKIKTSLRTYETYPITFDFTHDEIITMDRVYRIDGKDVSRNEFIELLYDDPLLDARDLTDNPESVII